MRQFTTLFMVLACLFANAQLSGTYTIDNFYPTKIRKGNFSTITDAINAVDEKGLKGNVEFIIEKGKYYEPIVFENINTDGEYTITFKAEEGEKVSFINDALALYLENCKNIIFEDIIFYSKSCQYTSILQLQNSSNISFENCDVSSKNVLANDRALVTISEGSNNNHFESNTFFGYNCFYIEKSSNDCFFQANTITAYNVGFFVTDAQNTIIHNNQMTKSNTAIAIDEQAEDLVITDNDIQDVTRALTQVSLDNESSSDYQFSGEMECNNVSSEKDAIKLLTNINGFKVGENDIDVDDGNIYYIKKSTPTKVEKTTESTEGDLSTLN